MPTRPRRTATEREGVNCVRTVVERANSIFNEIHRENDYGNDAFVELVEGDRVTGIYLLFQIKSGRSYCTSTTCKIPASVDKFEYWRNHRLTVVGVVYDPDDNCAYWTNISSFLRRNPLLAREGPYRLTFAKLPLNRFDQGGFQDFFLPIFLGKSIVLDFRRSLEFPFSDSFEMHSIGVKSLFFGYRNDEKTWDIFEKILRNRPPEKTTGYLAYILAHVPGHGDIIWHSQSILDGELRKLLMERMAKYEAEMILPLIRLVDENGFQRASVGESVYAILDLAVENSPSKLSKIILDSSVGTATRCTALTLFCLIEQERAERLLQAIGRDDSRLREWADDLLHHFEKEGFFYPG